MKRRNLWFPIIALAAVPATFGCAAETDDTDPEQIFETEQAFHETACLNTVNSSYALPNPAGNCGYTAWNTLSTTSTTYGATGCPNQWNARFTNIGSVLDEVRPRVDWDYTNAPLTSSSVCGTALKVGTFWAQRRSDNQWIHIASTRHVGQWVGSSCVFLTPEPGYSNNPSIDPAVYKAVHVAGSNSLLFFKKPVRIAMAWDYPDC